MNLCICTYSCSFYHFSLELLIYTPCPFLIDLHSFSIIYPCISFAHFKLLIYVLLRKFVLCLLKNYKYFPICSFSPQNCFNAMLFGFVFYVMLWKPYLFIVYKKLIFFLVFVFKISVIYLGIRSEIEVQTHIFLNGFQVFVRHC